MKKLIIFTYISLCVTTIFAQNEHHQVADSIKTQTKPKSPKMQTMEMVGANHVHINYASPSVRGRAIWNGLVAYDQVWSAGAHKATTIEFGQDVRITGTLVPAGKYGFFAIPGKKKWTLILSKTWDMHLADDYKIENDLIRFMVKPKKNKDTIEALIYEVKSLDSNKGKITLSWEKLNVSFEFTNQ